MTNLRYAMIAALVAPLAACRGATPERPSGDQISVTWALVRNQQSAGIFRSRITLSNNAPVPLRNRDWILYFNFAPAIVPDSVPSSIRLSHINGDFYSLAPAEDFPALEPGGSTSVELDAHHWITNESGAPAGFYFVFLDRNGLPETPEAVAEVRVEPFVTAEQLNRSPEDRVAVPTPESRYRENASLTLLPPDRIARIVPSPVRWSEGRGRLTLDASFAIHFERGLENEAAFLAASLRSLLGKDILRRESAASGAGVIALRTAPMTVAGREREAYRLRVDPARGITITGSDPAGVFYGIQSLRALVPVAAWRSVQQSIELPETSVEDAPLFTHRGMHLDVARNFHGAETVRKLLDLMSFYKLNRFHFHLTDDEGWRIAIEGLPELTSVGGRRGHTTDEKDRLFPSFGSGPDPDPAASHGSGHYSREEFIGILRHARERHIEVIPEIDVPGHARAAIRSMDARHDRLLEAGTKEAAEEFLLRDPEDRSQYRSVQNWNDNVINVCSESTYRFLARVVDEIVAMYREAEAPLAHVHIGGDEVPRGVWEKSPACGRLFSDPAAGVRDVSGLPVYFLRRLADILESRGLKVAGWEEIALTEDRAGGEGKEPNPEFVQRGFRPNVWNAIWGWGGEENAYRLANAGYKVVISNASNFYFDLAYDRDPKEIGYEWAGFVDTRKTWEFAPFHLYKSALQDVMGNPMDPSAFSGSARLTPAGRANILGIQGQLWAENSRGRELMEYLAFPRLIALAERAWAQEPAWAGLADPSRRREESQREWNRLANALGQRELPRLDYLSGGVNYRIPPPGAVVEGGVVKAAVEFPGLTIRYTTDGSEPTADSSIWAEPVTAAGTVKLRTFDTRGRGSRVSVVRR